MKKLKAWLLFHANKGSNNTAFYNIKNQLLEKYGKYIGTDLQEISNKQCYSCQGTGIFRSNWKGADLCWNCGGSGVFRKGFYTVLEKYSFCGYIFHSPVLKLETKPDDIEVSIKGYIYKTESKYTLFARLVLGLMFGLKKSIILETNYINVYWAYKWWHCKNWLRNCLYIVAYKRFPPVSKPLKDLIDYFKYKKYSPDDQNLPF